MAGVGVRDQSEEARASAGTRRLRRRGPARAGRALAERVIAPEEGPVALDGAIDPGLPASEAGRGRGIAGR